MPIYVYRCNKCSKEIEKIVMVKAIKDLKDEEPESCECGGSFKRTWGAPNLKFIGPDFYVNESRKDKEKLRIAKDYDTCKRRVAEKDALRKEGVPVPPPRRNSK